MTRGRPARINPMISRKAAFDRDSSTGGWRKVMPQRFRLGVPLGLSGDDLSNKQLRDERFEYSVRRHRIERAMLADLGRPATELELDRIGIDSERLALLEMRSLQRNAGTWVTKAPRSKGKPGPKTKSNAVVRRWLQAKRRTPALTISSYARKVDPMNSEAARKRLTRAINAKTRTNSTRK